jgi:hypothetical protein
MDGKARSGKVKRALHGDPYQVGKIIGVAVFQGLKARLFGSFKNLDL